MKPFLVALGILSFLAVVAGGVFMSMGLGSPTDYSALTGAEVYEKLCYQCHGTRGTSPHGVGNSYVGKRDYWDRESLLAYINNPRKVKAKMPHLRKSRKAMNPIPRSVPADARERLVDHVLQLMDALK